MVEGLNSQEVGKGWFLGDGLGPGNQTQKEFSLSEKQGGQWLEGCKGRILGHQKGEWSWVGQVLEGHC